MEEIILTDQYQPSEGVEGGWWYFLRVITLSILMIGRWFKNENDGLEELFQMNLRWARSELRARSGVPKRVRRMGVAFRVKMGSKLRQILIDCSFNIGLPPHIDEYATPASYYRERALFKTAHISYHAYPAQKRTTPLHIFTIFAKFT